MIQGKKIQPPNPINMHNDYNILYVYTNRVEELLVGDVQAQPLRTICVNNGDSHTMQTISFDSPHYMSVNKGDFDTIKINIMDEMGKKFQFLLHVLWYSYILGCGSTFFFNK